MWRSGWNMVWTRSTAAYTLAWIGQERSFPPTRASGCRGRCGWIFSYLCHLYGVKDEWLAASKSCIDFLEEHCVNHDAAGRLYFTVTAEGKPLRQRRYCFSEAFYALANAEYYGVTGRREHLERARRAYDLIGT